MWSLGIILYQLVS